MSSSSGESSCVTSRSTSSSLSLVRGGVTSSGIDSGPSALASTGAPASEDNNASSPDRAQALSTASGLGTGAESGPRSLSSEASASLDSPEELPVVLFTGSPLAGGVPALARATVAKQRTPCCPQYLICVSTGDGDHPVSTAKTGSSARSSDVRPDLSAALRS